MKTLMMLLVVLGSAIFATNSTWAQSSPLNLEIHGFGHVQYDVERVDPNSGPSDTTNNFANGGVDLFITSELSDSFNFLNETVFEFGEDGENIVDVERVLLKYTASDAFNLSAGRGHTALGYWNQRYHHGTWLQTTTDRPLMYAFEDDGGILPVHFVGLEASGVIADGQLSYTFNVANGRGAITDEVQLIEDKNDSKMVSLLLTYEPETLEGFGIGVNALYDKIPEDMGVLGREKEIEEIIYGAHLFYVEYPWEIISEIQFIEHDVAGSGGSFSHNALYAQIAYSIGKFKPYYRYDRMDIESGDPFFTIGVESTIEDKDQHTVGIRWDVDTYVALKLEYRHLNGDSEDSDAATLQASFAF